MINYAIINIQRLVVHTILEKKPTQDHSTVSLSNEVMVPDAEVIGLLRLRLRDAVGKHARAFEMKIENKQPESFYDYASSISGSSDEEFLQTSINIAELLAECQHRPNIRDSFLLVLEASDAATNVPVIIVIKAEPDSALGLSTHDGRTQLRVLKEVFLSHSQRLFKIGIMFHDGVDTQGSVKYGCILYDEQFRIETQPAAYFYSEFLGFSADENSKLQTQRFYNKSEGFININVHEPELKYPSD